MDRPSKFFNSTQLSRRRFIKCSVTLAASSTFPHIIYANTGLSSERTLDFINLHTDETLRCCYWVNGKYDTNSLSEINHILRDHRANEVHEIDSSLIDLLHSLHETVGSKAPFHIISGYRSPQTNQKLQKQSNGVATKSLHMQGKAIDIRLPDIKLKDLRDAALSLHAGGVGFYPKSNFIHIDVGKPRSW